MKEIIIGIAANLILLGTLNMAHATLTTIGTATYKGTDYNLIWDDDNNGKSLIWFDYSNVGENWATQNAWAAGLDSSLTYNIDASYEIIWIDNIWRLPYTVDGLYQWNFTGDTTAGYNITNSEMGHLFYDELGNVGYYDTFGNIQTAFGMKNTGEFNNLVIFDGLIASRYWSGTDYSAISYYAWLFDTYRLAQSYHYNTATEYGLAVRTAQVQKVTLVPEPSTMLFFGIGIMGFIAVAVAARI